jgi:predicted anti-sigma-YlaC factor YlaD
MECREKNVRDLIVDYIDGNLDSSSADRVKRHLKDCPECSRLEREYLRTVEGLRAVFKESAREHVPNEILVEFVERSEDLDAHGKASIELHLAVCPLCERKVEMLRRVGVEETPRQSNVIRDWLPGFGQNLIHAFGRRPAMGFSMAAVLILAFAVIYWSVTGIDRGLQIQFTSTQDIGWLQESLRSDQAWPEIREKNGFIRIGVKFLAFFEEEEYTIQLQSMDGTALQKLLIKRENYDNIGIGLSIETSSLSAGKYRLLLISHKLAGEKRTLQVAYPFILVKDGS